MNRKLQETLRALATSAIGDPLARVRGGRLNSNRFRYGGLNLAVAVTVNK